MLGGDLTRAAVVALTDGAEGLAAIGLQPLQPVLPMLAATSASVGEAIGACGLSSVEWKLDGIRLQVHRARRRGPHLHPQPQRRDRHAPGAGRLAKSLPADSLRARRRGRRPGRRRTAGAVPGHDEPLRSRVGQHAHDPLLRLSASGWRRSRRPAAARAGRSARPDHGTVAHPCHRHRRPRRGRGVPRGVAGLWSRGRDGEGRARRRTRRAARGSSWRKVKPVRTYDLVVLAAEWGHGRRQGWLSNIHLGARDPARASS